MDEQRRIAAFPDQADALRVKRREALARLDDLTRSIFLDMFGNSREMPRQAWAESVLEFRYGTSNKSEADGHPAHPGNVGRCAVFTSSATRGSGHNPDHFIYASYLIRARLDVNRTNPVFVREFMPGTTGRRQLRERCKTSAGQYNINIDGIGSVELPVVPLAHQERFATHVAEIEKSRRMQQVHLARLETLFASLQSRAFG